MIYERDLVQLDKFGKKEFIIFDYYDGIKGEFYIKEGIILFWYDYEEDGELWFVIKTEKQLIEDFLKNRLSALELFKNDKSEVFLYERPYDEYEKLNFIKSLTKEELNNYELPEEDAYLGYEFNEEFLKEDEEKLVCLEDKEEESQKVSYNYSISRFYLKNFFSIEQNELNKFYGEILLAA